MGKIFTTVVKWFSDRKVAKEAKKLAEVEEKKIKKDATKARLHKIEVDVKKFIASVIFFFVAVFSHAIKSIESLFTDIRGHWDARLFWGNLFFAATIATSAFALFLIYSNKTVDLFGIVAIDSILGGFALTLFGISGKALNPDGATPQNGGIADFVSTTIASIRSKIGG